MAAANPGRLINGLESTYKIGFSCPSKWVHLCYYKSPAVLSDCFLSLEGKEPGASKGRPLKPLGEHLWVIDDNYLK